MCWKRAATILVYKKRETSDPANFRPITLQPVWCKIFTTILKNRVYSFLLDNDFIDKKIQKGFWPKMDGVSEHTELLTHLIADGKRNARSLVVSLMDLSERCNITSSEQQLSITTCQNLLRIFSIAYTET